MFYINEFNKKTGIIHRIEITPDNVKTLCAECGCQFNVDLGEVLSDDANSLTTEILCRDCTDKVLIAAGVNINYLGEISRHAAINQKSEDNDNE